MRKFMNLKTFCAGVLCFAGLAVPASGQLVADLSVVVSDEPDANGIYTYEYTIETNAFSTSSVDWFRLQVASGLAVVEGENVFVDGVNDQFGDYTGDGLIDRQFVTRSLNAPENWVGEYQPYELELDANFFVTGFQLGNDGEPEFTRDHEITFLAGDGLICDHPVGGVLVGTTETFVIESTYAPQMQDYEIGKTDAFCELTALTTGTILAPTVPPSEPPPPGLTCDINEDGMCDLLDADELSLGLAAGTEIQFDLNEDGELNSGDLDFFLADESVLKVNGDANFDGNVDVRDFLTLSRNFNESNLPFSQGDFNADAEVTTRDFLILSRNFGATLAGGSSAAAVPEPNGLLLVCCGFVGLMTLRRRNR